LLEMRNKLIEQSRCIGKVSVQFSSTAHLLEMRRLKV
jgi:hypothetical protein